MEAGNSNLKNWVSKFWNQISFASEHALWLKSLILYRPWMSVSNPTSAHTLHFLKVEHWKNVSLVPALQKRSVESSWKSVCTNICPWRLLSIVAAIWFKSAHPIFLLFNCCLSFLCLHVKIEVGSTNVRVGSIIFGNREYPNSALNTPNPSPGPSPGPSPVPSPEKTSKMVSEDAAKKMQHLTVSER